MVTIPLTAGTDLHSVEEFKQLVIQRSGDSIVRLEDVVNVVLGSENYDFNVAFGGIRSVFVGIKVAPDANILAGSACVTRFRRSATSCRPAWLARSSMTRPSTSTPRSMRWSRPWSKRC